MKINSKLFMVIPVERDDGTKVFVHAAPISREVFESYYLVIAKTFSSLYQEGLGVTSGPRVAAMALRRIAEEMGIWSGEVGVERGLMLEIERLCSVLAPGPRGWEPVPLREAIKRQILDSDDASEVMNAITFFSVAYSVHRKTDREAILKAASGFWGAQIVLSDSTVYSASLPTSTAAETSQSKAGLSVPS